jgi:hypothetical protein
MLRNSIIDGPNIFRDSSQGGSRLLPAIRRMIARVPHGLALALLLLEACSADKPISSRPRAPAAGSGDAPAAMNETSEQPSTDAPAEATPPMAPELATVPDAGLAMHAEPNAINILKDSCASASVQSELLPSNLLFVLDRSGSMNCNPPPTTKSEACEAKPERADAKSASKWEITRDALNAAFQLLPASASVGLSYFSNDDECGVNSTPSVALGKLDTTQLSALKASLDEVKPKGGTPIVGATILAYKHLHALALDHKLDGNSFVVLLTDGQQSDQCSDPDQCSDAQACTDLLTQHEVPKAAGPGADIRTFVIGAPGSEPARAVLSQIALKGGTAPAGCDAAAGECHFDMTRQSNFASALTRALTAITNKASNCELPLPKIEKMKLDPMRVNVVYTPGDGTPARVVPQDTRSSCDTAEGWQYSADASKIQLCGEICSSVRTDASARLDVVLGCPVQGPS